MELIGITGGIGMGKSAVAEYLSRCGEQVVDTDLLARDVVAPGRGALEEIERRFGRSVISREGTLNRAALAEIVFQDERKRAELESIVHPRIRSAWLKWAQERRNTGVKRAFVVIPLLFETSAEKEFGKVICVASSAATQHQRLAQRGWTEQEITRRLAAQLSIREKMDRAQHVVWNEYSLQICAEQVRRIVGLN